MINLEVMKLWTDNGCECGSGQAAKTYWLFADVHGRAWKGKCFWPPLKWFFRGKSK